MAVRLALGETQVIAGTGKDLGDAGVNISALEGAAAAAGKGAGGVTAAKVKRSDKVLVVKNLPYSSEEANCLFCCWCHRRRSPAVPSFPPPVDTGVGGVSYGAG